MVTSLKRNFFFSPYRHDLAAFRFEILKTTPTAGSNRHFDRIGEVPDETETHRRFTVAGRFGIGAIWTALR